MYLGLRPDIALYLFELLCLDNCYVCHNLLPGDVVEPSNDVSAWVDQTDGWERTSPKDVGVDAGDTGMAAEHTRDTAYINYFAYIYAPIGDYFKTKNWRRWCDITLYLLELLCLDNCYVCRKFIAWCVSPYLLGTCVRI